MNRYIFPLLLLTASLSASSQALDQLGVKKGVTMSGSVNASSTLFNSGLNLNYSPKGKQAEGTTHKTTHNFGASVMWMLRGAAAAQPGYNELTSTINYTYSF